MTPEAAQPADGPSEQTINPIRTELVQELRAKVCDGRGPAGG
jgi:hypothetical protein